MELINELKIGNLVSINDQVVVMDVKMFHAVIHGFKGYNPKPIRLDFSYLHELKFKIPYQIIFMTGDRFGGGEYFFWSWDVDRRHPITFVHELQNWYFLLSKGQELEIKTE